MNVAEALTVACPACQAPKGELCTTPTSTGRREVTWVHHDREDKAKEARNVS